jgi:hypothetical protein
VARTRPGSDRPLRFTQTTEPDDTDEEPDEDDGPGDGPPPTSLDDLTTEADPQQFDQTFVAGDASLTIQGRFDPVAGARQVIPRVAYVLNYNLVYNGSRDRWEPQKKSNQPAASGTAAVQDAGTNQPVPAGSLVQVQLDTEDYDDHDGLDLTNDQIIIQDTGLYVVTGAVQLDALDAGTLMQVVIQTDGTTNTGLDVGNPEGSAQETGSSIGTVDRFNEGTAISLHVRHQGSGSETVTGGKRAGRLSVAQIGGPP